MAAESTQNFNDQYMLISNKLKKRFLRKPNVAEASNEFRSLALQCEISEQPIFAAHSYLGAAKCENALSNFVAEAEFFLVAARQFIYAEIQLKSMKCYSPSRDNVENAISCYTQASEKYPDNSRMRVSISMEIANNLQILGFFNEANIYYKMAIECWPENIAFKVQCLCRMAEVLFKIAADFEGSLTRLTGIVLLETSFPWLKEFFFMNNSDNMDLKAQLKLTEPP